MQSIFVNILVGAVGACVGLYLLWEVKEGIQCLMIRRRTKRAYESRGASICRWGFNSKGELGHVRCKHRCQGLSRNAEIMSFTTGNF
jgi:hypothetical protein